MLLATIPRLVALVVRVVGPTLRYEHVFAPGAVRGDLPPGPCVYAFWHRTLLSSAHFFRNRGIAILISRSFDGELIARTVEHLGFVAIRGSSSRGAATGLRQMAEAYAAGHKCAFTADGPRGPAMVAKAGPAQLAHLAGDPQVGAFYILPESAWVLNTWDRFLIPKPFSRVVITWPGVVEPEQQAIQQTLDRAVAMAEAWIKTQASRLD